MITKNTSCRNTLTTLRDSRDKIPMTDMLVLAFDNIDGASNVKNKLVELNTQFLLKLDQIVEVVRKADGQVKIKEEPKLTGVAALGGAFWGLLIGLIFLVPGVGVAVGAVSGAIVGHFAKYGISKEFMSQVDAAIQPGQSALFILAEDVKADRVVPMLSQFHPRVLRTSLTLEQEAKLKEAFGSSSSVTSSVV
jgi:uncharacterized membrane protein